MSRNKKGVPLRADNSNNVAQNAKSDVTIQATQYSGPVPPPDVLRGFEQIVPGSAERILTMAEENGKHQREMERMTLSAAYTTIRLGQFFGLFIGLAALATCAYALYLGYEDTAIAIGGSTIVGLVAIFVIGRFKKSNNSNS